MSVQGMNTFLRTQLSYGKALIIACVPHHGSSVNTSVMFLIVLFILWHLSEKLVHHHEEMLLKFREHSPQLLIGELKTFFVCDKFSIFSSVPMMKVCFLEIGQMNLVEVWRLRSGVVPLKSCNDSIERESL